LVYLDDFVQQNAVDVEKESGRQFSLIFLESEDEESQETDMMWAQGVFCWRRRDGFLLGHVQMADASKSLNAT
jgi:hypothetical protein